MTPLEWTLIGWAVHAGIEYWLGKTKKVEASSVLELVATAATKILRK